MSISSTLYWSLVNGLQQVAFYAVPRNSRGFKTRFTPSEQLRRNTASDYEFLSFPKCGRTWMRLLLGVSLAQYHRLWYRKRFLFHEILAGRQHLLNPGIPFITYTHNIGPLIHDKYSDPELLNGLERYFVGKPFIFLMRDPRDVVVSWYFALNRRKVKKLDQYYGGTLEAFVREERHGLANIVNFYNAVAKSLPSAGRIHRLNYEDLSRHTHLELAKTLAFLGVDYYNERAISKAIATCRFSQMQKLEKVDYARKNALKAANLSDPESFKARKGKVGGYAEYLSPETLDYLNEYIEKHLSSQFYQYKNQPIENSLPEALHSLKGLLQSRHCLLLGSARAPELPALNSDIQFICVNSSGWMLKNLGLSAPLLTVLGAHKLNKTEKLEDRKALKGLKTKHLLVILEEHETERDHDKYRRQLAELEYSFQKIHFVSREGRQQIFERILGTPFGEGSKFCTRPSNGVFATCTSLLLGAKSISLAGFSLEAKGHSYPRADRRRYHIFPDQLAFAELIKRKYPVIFSDSEINARIKTLIS